MSLDTYFIIVYADARCSQPYNWRDEAERIVALTKVIGDRRPIGLLKIKPKRRLR